MEDKTDKLSFGLCLSVAGIILTENIVMNLIYPILPFMVEFYEQNNNDHSGPATEEIISDHSGDLEGAYRFMQVFACIFW
jgi:hypothetical protein